MKKRLLVFLTCLTFSASPPSRAEEPFFRVVELPLQLMVIHREHHEIGSTFFETVLDQDIGGFIDHSGTVRTFNDADVVAVFLSEWSEASELPFQNELAQTYDAIASFDVDTHAITSRLFLLDGRQVAMIFYSDEALPNSDVLCAADIFFIALSYGFEVEAISLDAGLTECGLTR